MVSSKKFQNKILSAFIAACLVVILLVTILWKLSRNADRSMGWVAESYEILDSIIQVKAYTVLIELDTQSFRITGDKKRIEERDKLISARENSLKIIEKYTLSFPDQLVRLHQLRNVIKERLEISRRMVFLRNTQGQKAADNYIATTSLQATRDLIFKLLLDMEVDAHYHLNQRLNEMQKTKQIMTSVGEGVGVILIFFLVLTLILIRRQVNTIELSHLELAESEKKLTVTLQSIGDGVIATDTFGLVTQMNPVAEQLTGWPFSEAVGRPIKDIFNIYNELTGEQSVIPIINAIQSREIQSLQNHTILVDRNGKQRPIGDSAAPIIDSNGNLSGVVMVFRDVGLERQAARIVKEQNVQLEKAVLDRTFALQETKEDLRRVTDNVPALIAHVDADLKYDYANSKYIDLFSPHNLNILGLTVLEVLGKSRFEKVENYIKGALSGNSVIYDWQPFPDIWQSVNYVPTLDKMGIVTGYYVLITDVTDRKLSEIKTYNITHYDGLTDLDLLPSIRVGVVHYIP